MTLREIEEAEVYADKYGPDGPWYCENCGKECATKWVDNGVGPYEFWGSRGVDRRLEEVSRCCEAPVTDINPHPVDEVDKGDE